MTLWLWHEPAHYLSSLCASSRPVITTFPYALVTSSCPSQSEATCRAVSAALRCGVDPTVLIEQLKGIRCLSTCVARKDNKDIVVLSCPDAIARAIQEAMGGNGDVPESVILNPCPECGQSLRKEAGCLVCANCGYTKCG